MMRFYVPAVLLLSLVLMTSGEAQIKSGARASASLDNAGFAQASNVAITVAVDRHSGQFAVRTKKGVPLLFFQGDNATSFANVRLGSTVFTNNDLHRPQPPLGTTRMPAGIAREEGDSVVFVAVLRAGSDSVSLRMDFVPMLESDYAFVRVRTSVRNLGARVLDAGFLLMLDVFLEHSDLVSLAVQSDTVRLEREWFGDAIPDQWHGRVAGSPIVVRGRLRGGGTDAPSRFVAGQWQDNGYLGAAAWDYRASGLRIWDAAVLSQWDQRALAPGASFTIVTDYGYLADFDAALACGAERVAVNAAQNAYTPDPFTVSAVVRSTGSLPLPSWSLRIGVPPGARLAAGENQTHSSSVPLSPGDSVRVAWRFHADATDTLRRLSFPIDLTDPAQKAQRCTAETRIPPMPRFEAALSCPDTLSLNLNADSSAYDPTTIPLTVTVRNTGTAVLSALTATITVPSELRLVGGAASVPIVPATLAPGATGSAGWVLEALPRSTAALVQVGVIVSGAGLDTLRCTSHISIPAIIPKQICTDSAATIRGREFWLAFPPNNGSGTLTLRVFASAVEAARVTITRGWLGRSNDITVPAGGTAYFDVEESAQEILPETPVKRGVFVRSDRPVSITIASLVENHSDASLVLPLHALGTSYHAAGYNYSTTDEQFVVVATEDATSVTITPFGLTSTRRPPRVPFQVTLQQGDCYRVQSGITGAFGGLTGSFIVADKPVTVFGGAQSGWIPENSLPNYGFLNHHAEQLPPDDFLGKEFLAMPFLSRRRGDTYKVVATADSTDVTIGTDAPVRLAQRGDWMEFQRAETAVIKASKPVSVAQFANSAAWDEFSNEYGDASMTMLVPSDRFSACHVVPSVILGTDVPNDNAGLELTSGNWIDVQDNPIIASPVFTTECWIKLLSGGLIVTRDASSGMPSDWQLWCEWSRKRLAFITAKTPPDQYFYTADNSIVPGRWYHLAVTADGPRGEAHVYIDGVLAVTATFTSRLFDATTGLAWGGYYNNATGAYLNAVLDEARYWGEVRTQAQIQASMYRRLFPHEKTSALLGYWSFCGNMVDSSMYAHRTNVRGRARLVGIADHPYALGCGISSTVSSFLNLTVHEGGESAVVIDGVPLPDTAFHRVPLTTLRAARLAVSNTTHSVETSDPRGVGVTAYGFSYHDAYSFNAGYRTNRGPRVTGLTDPAAPTDGGFAALPNPSSGVVRFYIPSDVEDGELVLYDLHGRRVAAIPVGRSLRGTWTGELNLRDVPAGMYVAMLQTRIGTRTLRVLRTR